MRFFSKEIEMRPAVMDWLGGIVEHVETELYCGYAGEYVPDVVGISFDHAALANSKRKTPMTRSRIKELLGKGSLETYHTDIIAVELKLDRFVEAYFQARKYQSYGFKTYIAMTEGKYWSLKSIRTEILKRDGVGFLEVGEQVKVMLEAKEPTDFSLEEIWQITERLAMNFKLEKQRIDNR